MGRAAQARITPLLLAAVATLAAPGVPPARASAECLATGAGTSQRFRWEELDLQQRTEACARTEARPRDETGRRPDPLLSPAPRPPGLAGEGQRPSPTRLRTIPERRTVPGSRRPSCRGADCLTP